MNGKGVANGGMWLPLVAAVSLGNFDLVVWLLSQGADPNADGVMLFGARNSTAAILELLIDAGADVNTESGGVPPLTAASLLCATGDQYEKLRVMLAQPDLNIDRCSTTSILCRISYGEAYDVDPYVNMFIGVSTSQIVTAALAYSVVTVVVVLQCGRLGELNQLQALQASKRSSLEENDLRSKARLVRTSPVKSSCAVRSRTR